MLTPSTSSPLQPYGSGALEGSDIWHEVFGMIGTSSGALVIDRWMPASTHAATLHRAMRMLMQPEQGTRITCAVDIDSLVDFDTEKLDTGLSNGLVQRSINHYWCATVSCG